MRSKMLSLNFFLFVEDLLFYSFLWANGISRLLAVQKHLVKYSVPDMVFVLDGCLFYYAQIWIKSGIST